MEMGMTPVSTEKNSHGFVSVQAEISAPLRYPAITDTTPFEGLL